MSLALAPFKTFIKERCGLLFDENGDKKLALALAERIKLLEINATDYYARLHNSEVEFQELVNMLTINETYFFREPEQIRLLVDHLAPRFLAAHGGLAPVRILSAGCSSGEEPYSLVMALMDKYGESVSRLFSFAGGDIDSTVLAKARHAIYTDFSFRGVSPEIRRRYFDKDGWRNVLKPQIKQLVNFHELNLFADHFPPALHNFDIIFFRNVSIYFDAPTRKTIQGNLCNLLKNNGILVIGTAETLANDLGVLPLVEENGLFYFVKGSPPLAEAIAPPSKPMSLAKAAWQIPPFAGIPVASTPQIQVPPGEWSLPTVNSTVAKAEMSAPELGTELTLARQLTRDKRYDEALPLLNTILSSEPKQIEARLLKAHLLLNRKDLSGTESLAQDVLADNNWSVDALLLLGLAAKWRNQPDVAKSWLKKAVYAKHECWPAHYYLADLYRHSQELEHARRAYRVTLQLLSSETSDTGINFVPLGLPTVEVRFLCEHQLAKLSTDQPSVGRK